MLVDDHLRDERSPRVAEDDDREPRVLGVDGLGELPDRGDRRAQSPASEVPELGGVAVLLHPRAAVPAQIARVHDVARRGQGLDQCDIPAAVLADAVQELHHRPRRRFGGMDVVDDRDAVCIDELGHAPESRSRGCLALQSSRGVDHLLSNANKLC